MAHVKRVRKEKGQTLVEFALTLPILLAFLFGIFDFGRALITYTQASSNLRSALRQAPVVGYADASVASYLDCDTMEDMANDIFFAEDIVVEITHHLIIAGKTGVDCAGFNDADVNNGDYITIKTTARLDMIVLPFTLNMEFEGQRTIIKTFNVGSLTGNDTDFDGLDDNWEITNFGSIECQTGLDDANDDGISNGQHEYEGTSPGPCPTP